MPPPGQAALMLAAKAKASVFASPLSTPGTLLLWTWAQHGEAIDQAQGVPFGGPVIWKTRKQQGPVGGGHVPSAGSGPITVSDPLTGAPVGLPTRK